MQTLTCPCLKSFQCLHVERTVMYHNKNTNAKVSQSSIISVIKRRNHCSPAINIRIEELVNRCATCSLKVLNKDEDKKCLCQILIL